MKIAIFDENCNKELKQLIYKFSNHKKLDLVVEIFNTPDAILNNIDDYCLLFISFETQNGIYLAKKIYDWYDKIPIIITANDCRLAAEAFKINAYNFLKIPIDANCLFDVLESFFSDCKYSPLLINNGMDLFCVYTNDILYLEADNKHCFLHLKNQTLHCNKTMARVYDTLPDEEFLKINRAFVVNKNYVSHFNSKQITLKNGDTLYPSRHYYKTFKYDYIRIMEPIIP